MPHTLATSKVAAKTSQGVVGLDFGSSFNAMVVWSGGTNKPTAVDDYDGAPTLHSQRPREIPEVPSVVSVSSGGGVVAGYPALTAHGTLFTNIKSALSDDDSDMSTELREQLEKKLRVVNASLKEDPLSGRHLIAGILLYQYEHLDQWCRSRKIPMPRKTIATHPVSWRAETIIE